MIQTDDFLNLFKNQDLDKVVRLGKIDANYSSGKPSIVFDGESEPSGKTYPYLASYTPKADDRVMLIKNVVIGKIETA